MGIDRDKIKTALTDAEEGLKTATAKAKEAAEAAGGATAAEEILTKEQLEVLREQAVDLYQQTAALKLWVELNSAS
jgi:hypothetical protein